MRLAIFLVIILSEVSFAQKTVEHTNHIWLQYHNQVIFEKVRLYTDLSQRFNQNFNHFTQSTARTALFYPLNKTWSASTGASGFLFYDDNNQVNRWEIRPHQEFNLESKFSNFQINHRYRAEFRYFTNIPATDNPNLHYIRLRYRIMLLKPIYSLDENENRSIKLILSNEIFVNIGNQIIHNMLDNNRTLIGFQFDVHQNITPFVTYTYQFGQRTQATQYEQTDILGIGIIHKMENKNSQ